MHASFLISALPVVALLLSPAYAQESSTKPDTLAARLTSAKFVSIESLSGPTAIEVRVISEQEFRDASEKKLAADTSSERMIKLSQELRDASPTEADKQRRLREELTEISMARSRSRSIPYKVLAIHGDYIELATSSDAGSVILIPLRQIARVRMAKPNSPDAIGVAR